MVERNRWLTALSHAVMLLGILIVAFPIYLAFAASTHSASEIMQAPMPLWPGQHLWQSYSDALTGGGRTSGTASVPRMMLVSLVVTLIITFGKIAISLISAFAIVYFRFPLRALCFWLIFITLMLPVEVRIGPTYEVVAKLKMINTFAGLSIPLIASATATFLFRQFFLTVPDELVEAARIDGASRWKQFLHITLPMLGPVLLVVGVITVSGYFQLFAEPYVMTRGDPLQSTVSVLYFMFEEGFKWWNLGRASAVAFLLFLIILAVTTVMLRFGRKRQLV